VLREHAEALAEPWSGGVYSFARSTVHDRLIALEVKHWGRFAGFTVPAQIVFLNRVVGGMYGNLRRLRATADWGALLRAQITPAPAPVALAG